MKFGYFDDQNKEYVIMTPKTPYPWINYLGSEQFFGLVSNTAGGYSFYQDARLRRLTRYRYNNVPVDSNGRYYYIKDGENVWNPGYMPTQTPLDTYECRHGMGYTKLNASKNNIICEVTMMVPNGFNGEVHKITLTNKDDQEKSIDFYGSTEFCLWDAHDDMTNFQRNFSTGEVEVDDYAIYHKTEFRERRNHYSFYGMNETMDSYETDRDIFLGVMNGYDNPIGLKQDKLSNSMASGWHPVGVQHKSIFLKAEESKTIIFVLGYTEVADNEKFEKPDIINKTPAREMMARFKTEEQFNEAFDILNSKWTQLLSPYQLESLDDRLNRMVNIWNPYQCMVTFNMSRSASYFESGIGRGMGFRDSSQDLIGFVHQVPSAARQRILDIAATQFEDGSAYHQYQPLTKKGNAEVGSGFNDDPCWLILAVAAYIKETGDFDILRESVEFENNPLKMGTLFDHLRASFHHVVNHLGPHGLPLIGRADWNDCLNLNCHSITSGESFQTTGVADGLVAESVFIAGLFLFVGEDYLQLAKHLGKDEETKFAEKHLDQMREQVHHHGYDDDWFLRAYNAYGDKIGSAENTEGKIFIEPQGICVMAGLGLDDGRAKKALDAVADHLETPYGIVLNQPPFKGYDPSLGEISSYPPGYKENGGIFCHTNPWIMCAETMIGRGERAFELYKKIAPAYIDDRSEIHKTEPYVYAQMIAGKDAKNFGQGKNSWLTGTAAWNYVAISQWILGIKPEYSGLRVKPMVASVLGDYTVTRDFRDATYKIHVVYDPTLEKGMTKIQVNGEAINGDLVPIQKIGEVHRIDVRTRH